MQILESEMTPLYEALEIAMNYLVRRGYGLLKANEKAAAHVVRLFLRGERRPLALANRAITAVEKEEEVEQQLRTISVFPVFRSSLP